MRAVCWTGVNEVSVETVPDPGLLNRHDAVVKVVASSTCGSDLHLIDGYVPTMMAGDILGHEFLGEIVEVGPDVRDRRVGERVVVCSIIGCGGCHYCRREMYSLCDNSNPNPGFLETMIGPRPPASSPTPTPSAGTPEATPSTCGCRSWTSTPSRCRRG